MPAAQTCPQNVRSLLDSLEHIRIDIPVETWFDVAASPRTNGRVAHHRYRDCSLIKQATTVTQQTRPIDQRPAVCCNECTARSALEWKENLEATAVLHTRMLLTGLVDTGCGHDGGIADMLFAFGEAKRTWRVLELATLNGRPPADGWEQELSPAAAAAKRDLETLTTAFLAAFDCATNQARRNSDEAALANELRYYCASALASSTDGAFDRHAASAPSYRDWSPDRPSGTDRRSATRPPEPGRASGALLAFASFRQELRETGALEVALARAEDTLRAAELDPAWIQPYLDSWVARLTELEAEQAAGGYVRLVLAPIYGLNPWQYNDELVLRWTDSIDRDGTLTMTVPAVLVEPIWERYAATWILPIDNQPGDPVTLHPASDSDEQVVAIARRFWSLGATTRFTAVLRDARLISA